MALIKFSIGQENSPVIETDGWITSIFADQYRHAVTNVENFLRYEDDDNLQVIAFCGERGSGKSSCMKSVIEMLRETHTGKNPHASEYLQSFNLNRVADTRFEIPSIIDPSFFSRENNILELILGQLYGDLKNFEHDNNFRIDRISCNKVFDSFSRIRECVLTMHGSERQSFNDYSELNVLSNSVRLRSEIQNLFKDYLSLIGKDKIIIAIDDLDLNARGAYEMCEQIRKYLSSPECIIFISFKYEQLYDVIAGSLKTSLRKESTDQLNNMVNRYLDKLFPNSLRIHMPMAYNLCNRILRIYDGNKVIPTREGCETVKDAVVNLIFQKTRFLFYNSKGGISPIVPNNLRDLFQLLGMLWNMPSIPIDKKSQIRREILESNKNEFKNYFFYFWTKCLTPDQISAVREWTLNTPDSTLNKTIVRWLANEFKNGLSRNYDTEEQTKITNLIGSIISESNFSYNVSVGDVFYIIYLLQQDILSPEQERILFFIKSYYSIRLYETYDIITESPGQRYPRETSHDEIYRIDHRFDHTNDLQRLLNGSYFTFRPGELVKNNRVSWNFDARIIKGGKGYLTQLFHGVCRDCIDNYDKFSSRLQELESIDETDEIKKEISDLKSNLESFRKCFRLAEFFILTISRSIISKDLKFFKILKDPYRAQVNPYALTPYNYQMGYYVFDVLNPFYALSNPEYAYSKFDELTGKTEKEVGLFEFALQHDFSLLHQMLVSINKDTSADRESMLNRLQSDAVIRNGEVLTAIFENVKRVRDTDKDTVGMGKISAFYKVITDTGMSTHPVADYEKAGPYRIKFSFLRVLIDFINTDLKDNYISKVFDDIFDGVENTPDIDIDLQKSNSEIGSKQFKEVNLTTMERIDFVDLLARYIGNESQSATEIWERLRKLYIPLRNSDDKSLQSFIVKKRGDRPYTLTQLTDYILKSEIRYKLWVDMLNKIQKVELESSLPF